MNIRDLKGHLNLSGLSITFDKDNIVVSKREFFDKKPYFCPNCHKSIEEWVNYCPYCGQFRA